jgi:hypothetical protein
MRFLGAYALIFSSSALIGLTEQVTDVSALAVLAGVLIYVLKWTRDDRKEFLKHIEELKKEIRSLKDHCNKVNSSKEERREV